MGNVIRIDDGSETFDIVNQRGELLGQFTFIPSDFDLVKRYEETVKAFEEAAKNKRQPLMISRLWMSVCASRWITCLMLRFPKTFSQSRHHSPC